MNEKNNKEIIRQHWLLHLKKDKKYKVYFKNSYVGTIMVSDKDVIYTSSLRESLFGDAFNERTLLAVLIASPDDVKFLEYENRYYFVEFDKSVNYFKVMEATDTGSAIDIKRKKENNYFPINEYSSEYIHKRIKSILSDSTANIIKSINSGV